MLAFLSNIINLWSKPALLSIVLKGLRNTVVLLSHTVLAHGIDLQRPPANFFFLFSKIMTDPGIMTGKSKH
jgi:hypothetical protein